MHCELHKLNLGFRDYPTDYAALKKCLNMTQYTDTAVSCQFTLAISAPSNRGSNACYVVVRVLHLLAALASIAFD